MASTDITQTQLAVSTGIVVIVFGAQDQVAGGVIERADDNGSGSAGTFAPVGTFNVIAPSGTPYIDPLPMDGAYRYYRAKHVRSGFTDSDYTATARARPDVIPADIDWSSSPWLYDGNIPLQLVMSVTGETTGSLTVSASINNDPAGLGTPYVSVLDYYGVSSPTIAGVNTWTITKPAAGVGRVTFENTLAGRQSGLDTIDIQSIQVNDSGSFLGLAMHQVSSSATQITVSGSVNNPKGYPATIFVDSYIGVPAPSPVSTNVWNILRPSSSMGSVVFHVTSSTPGVIDDIDTVFVDYQNMWPLSVTQRVTNVTTVAVSASFDVRDPFQASGSLTGLSYALTTSSLAGFTASVATGQITNANGVYSIPVYCTFPDFGQGKGWATITATKAGYTQDSDTLLVPDRTYGIGHLVAQLRATALGSTTVTVSGSAIDPTDASGSLGPPTLTFEVIPASSVSYTGTNPWVVNRPISGSITAMVTATRGGKVSDSAEVTISANTKAVTLSDYLDITAIETSHTATQVVVSCSVDNPASHPVTIDVFSTVNDAGYTGTNPFTITRPVDAVASYVFHVASTDPGIVDAYDSYTVYPTNTVPLILKYKPTASDSASLSVALQAYDPYNTTTTLSGITISGSTGGVSGVTINAVGSPVTSAGLTTYNYVITRPDPGAGSAIATFTATKTGYASDTCMIDLPEQGLYKCGIDLQLTSGSLWNYTLAVTGSDALGGASPTVAITANPMSLGTSTVSTTDTTGKEIVVYLINRPGMNASPADITFTVSKSGRQSISSHYSITPQPPSGSSGGTTSVDAFYVSATNMSTDTITLSWAVSNLPSAGTYDVMWSNDIGNSGTVTNTTSGLNGNQDSQDLVAKGTTSAILVTYTFTLLVKDMWGTVQASGTTTWTGWYLP